MEYSLSSGWSVIVLDKDIVIVFFVLSFIHLLGGGPWALMKGKMQVNQPNIEQITVWQLSALLSPL